MQLINQTVAPALARVGTVGGGRAARTVLVVAKLTYSIQGGRLELVSEDPVPVFEEDTVGPLGVWPSDIAPAYPPGFEVLLQGCAYPRRGSSTCSVQLSVGSSQCLLAVLGDRTWVAVDGTWSITQPQPFERMPLTWDRAFGGSSVVWFDEATRLPIREPRNPSGRGFDPSTAAASLGELWGAPAGFPRVEADNRLPNIEDPRDLVVLRKDAPRPFCWSAVPLDSSLRGEFAVAAGGVSDVGSEDEPRALPQSSLFWRAIDELRFDGSPLGEAIRVVGVRPDREDWAFNVPSLEVYVDCFLGSHAVSRPLHPRRLLLLCEEERFTLTFARRFAFNAGSPTGERSIRVRLHDPDRTQS